MQLFLEILSVWKQEVLNIITSGTFNLLTGHTNQKILSSISMVLSALLCVLWFWRNRKTFWRNIFDRKWVFNSSTALGFIKVEFGRYCSKSIQVTMYTARYICSI
jgi:hypothetical protein